MAWESQRRDVRQVEEIGAQLADVLSFATERLNEYKRTPRKVVVQDPAYPPVTDLLTRRLRAALEDEVIPAVEVTEEGKIRAYEVNREVIKKALIGLKAAGLRRIAKQANIPASSVGVERLAESIAHAYGWEEDAIARLVLENEEDIRPERGHSSRFYALKEVPDLEYVADRLSYVGGRYIRTGVAKWFVFNEVERLEHDQLRLSGAVREYSAGIDNRNVEHPRLHASPAQEATARVLIDTSTILTVEKASLAVAKAAVTATDEAAHLQPLRRVPYIDPQAPAARGEIHDSSRFMIDLLVNRLPAKGLGDINLTVVRFHLRADTPPQGLAGESERRASLRAVRIEGDYLLGSVQACQLIAVEQRPLTDMTLQIVVRNGERIIIGRYPVRISVERDHVAVETSYGAGNIETSVAVHKAVTDAVIAEINQGIGNEDRFNWFIEQVKLRAADDDASEHMDLLGVDDTLAGQPGD